jgi:enediyne biosynthesis protein E4
MGRIATPSGRLYWDGKRYDPATNGVTSTPQVPHVRSATRETPDGFVYGTSEKSADVWRFDVRTEQVTEIGPGAVAAAEYVTSIDADPTGRYLYYIPGAHGQAERDGTPVVQFNVQTGTRKVICFLNPCLREAVGYTPIGTFGSALSPDGSTLYVTWNGYRNGAPDEWDVCAMTVIHIPESERPIAGGPAVDEPSFVFRDVTEAAGLLPDVAGIKGHAAGWGDADGNGWIDLYVGAFHTGGSKPNMLFYNEGGTFRLDADPELRISCRPTGSLFADLDNDGDLDLYVSSMPKPDGTPALAGCTLFRNDGDDGFTNVSEDNGACPRAFGGRSAAVLDFDGDGLLDLLVGEDPLPGYNGSPTHSSRLFRNRGGLQFEDVTQVVGIPVGIPALGVAVGDVNNDGWPDVFLAAQNEGNRLLLNNGDGTFREAVELRELFTWETSGDNMVCGVCFGDVNRDGLLDIVLGQHFERPWIEPVANRLYLNRGIDGGVPQFEDVTETAGLVPLPMKAPHVEIQDFDNDGWPDICTSIVKFADGDPHPIIFRNLGSWDGTPRFQVHGLEVNDFPTDADRAVKRSGEFTTKMLAEKKIVYTAAGPSGDFDRDGRLDLFLANWWIESNSMLLHNETPGGHWLQVQVQAGNGVNRMGVGSRVNLYRAGAAGEPGAFLGCREIATGYGYASSQEAVAHFGLGEHTQCDVEVILPHGHGRIVRRNVQADQRITIHP